MIPQKKKKEKKVKEMVNSYIGHTLTWFYMLIKVETTLAPLVSFGQKQC